MATLQRLFGLGMGMGLAGVISACAPEVILQGTRRLFILDGRSGAELWSIDLESEN